jgi:hypothetical protein
MSGRCPLPRDTNSVSRASFLREEMRYLLVVVSAGFIHLDQTLTVKDLRAIEILGAVTVIASDKTVILTENSLCRA